MSKKRKITKKGKKELSSRDVARLIAQATNDKKALDLVVLDLRKQSSFTDYFVIASGRSDRQVQAIAAHIDDSLSKAGKRPIGLEGVQSGHWVLIDFGEVVAHIFYEEIRSFYDLERLWSEAPRVRFRLS